MTSTTEDLTQLDWSPLRQARGFLELLRAKFAMIDQGQLCPEFRRRSTSDPGVTLLLLSSLVQDLIHGRLDGEARQLIFGLATRPSNVDGFLRLIGAPRDNPQAAEATILVGLRDGETPTEDIPLGKFHPFLASSGAVPFCTINDNDVLPAFKAYAPIRVLHGYREVVDVARSDGTPLQMWPVSVQDILHNGTQRPSELYIVPPNTPEDEIDAKAERYTWVDDWFAFSGPTDRHAMLVRKTDGTSLLVFGTGKRGRVPVKGSLLRLVAVVGGGTAGRLAAGAIDTCTEPVQYNGRTYYLTASQPSDTEGGADLQTPADACRVKPYLARSRGAAKRDADYAAWAADDSAVLDAQATRLGQCVVPVYIVADTSSGIPSDPLCRRLEKNLTERSNGADKVRVSGCRFPRVAYEILVHPRGRAVSGAARAEVMKKTKEWFALRYRRRTLQVPLIGATGKRDGYLAYSDLIALLEPLAPVDSVEVRRFYRVPELVRVQWHGDVRLSEVTLSPSSREEVWTLHFVSSTSFRVRGSVSGPQGFGTLNVPFTDRAGRIAFTATGTAAQPADEGFFVSVPLLANVPAYDGECLVEGVGTILVDGED